MKAGRIAVTGVGIVSALGKSAEQTFERLVRGDVGFSEITLFDTTGQRTRTAGVVPDFRVEDVVPSPESARWSRSDALALLAAKDALSSARLPLEGGRRLGIAVGTTTAGMLEAETLLPTLPEGAAAVRQAAWLRSYPLASTADRLARYLGGSPRVRTLCSACSSGANAIVQGAAWLRTGVVDRVLAGGTDALCRLTLTGFNALGATDLGPCRPFDRRRAGLTLGEGAAFLVLEREHTARERGAPIFAWFSGAAVGAEAHHVTQPDPSADVPARLLRVALREAGLAPSDIDYVNAHGTGTVPNDAVETRAIHEVFGPDADRVLVSSSKGQIGHTLGAAGAIEAAITVLALDEQRVPPTGGLTEPDDACRLNHVLRSGKEVPLRAAASSSFGFGGMGAVLVFERADAAPRSAGSPSEVPVVITGVATIGPLGVVQGISNVDYLRSKSDRIGPPPNPLELLDPARSRRFDAQACFTTRGAEAALERAFVRPRDAGLVAGTAFGNVERTVRFVRAAATKGPGRVPPAEFPHLLPSAPSGNASIYLGLGGPVLTTSDLEASAEAAVAVACDWVEGGLSTTLVAGSAEPHDAFVRDVFGPACEDDASVPRTEGAAWVVVESARAARERGAAALAVVRRRDELATAELESGAIGPPSDPKRAVVVASAPRELERVLPVLARSGWGGVPRLLVADAAGFHEGVGGFAVAAAAALVGSGEASEALVAGGNGARAYFFHLETAR
jgi:3-oxoacyl-[acyl-carrier-protein] synthase II